MSMTSHLAVGLSFVEQARNSLAESRRLSRAGGTVDVEQVIKRAFEALGQASVAGPLVDVAVIEKGWLGRGDPWPKNASLINATRDLYSSSVAAQDQLTALSLFWTTTLNARMMTRLVRQR